MYDFYLGSRVDVSAPKNTIKKIKALRVEKFIIVMDRGSSAHRISKNTSQITSLS